VSKLRHCTGKDRTRGGGEGAGVQATLSELGRNWELHDDDSVPLGREAGVRRRHSVQC
jgi:hypothetical protein